MTTATATQQHTNLREPHDKGEYWVATTMMMMMNNRSDYNDDNKGLDK